MKITVILKMLCKILRLITFILHLYGTQDIQFFNPSPQGDKGALHRRGEGGLRLTIFPPGLRALVRHQRWLEIFSA